LGDLIGRVAKDSKHAAGGLVGVDEGWPINAEMPRPADGKVGVGFFNVDRLRIPIAGQSSGQPIRGVQQPGIAGVGGKQHQRTDADKAPFMGGSTALDVIL
jgi:hypothetical protein